MKMIFTSENYCKQLKANISAGKTLIYTNIKREIGSLAKKCANSNNYMGEISSIADNIIAFCNAVFYIDKNEHKANIAENINCLIAICENKAILSCENYMHLCSIIHGVNLVNDDNLNIQLGKLLNKVNELPPCENEWYYAYNAAFFAFCGNEQMLFKAFENYKTCILDKTDFDDIKQNIINPFSKCISILNSAAMVCEIAHNNNINLWQESNVKGLIEYIYPFVKNPYSWGVHKDKSPIAQDLFAFQLAGLRLNMPQLLSINESRAMLKQIIRPQQPLGPLALFENSPVLNSTKLYSKIGFNVRGYSHSK